MDKASNLDRAKRIEGFINGLKQTKVSASKPTTRPIIKKVLPKDPIISYFQNKNTTNLRLVSKTTLPYVMERRMFY